MSDCRHEPDKNTIEIESGYHRDYVWGAFRCKLCHEWLMFDGKLEIWG
jgi:hypothetical protein